MRQLEYFMLPLHFVYILLIYLPASSPHLMVLRVRPAQTITLDDIRVLLKKYLGIGTTRTTIYNWQQTKGFPHSLGLGRPRRWLRREVLEWIANQTKRRAPKKKR